ncbi:hypothetical protein U7230_00030 [Carboxydochorda subterranea]|uniref:Uncharacterized protein n=1 Tax=Carboxydichorda subterranea TaxID=3109565 RepID=A0ABZ1BXA8_9FIRM|nr:hypothetical protein [Limnochorda sp. L945t]WRP17440.1 hypothetical protein U7230_00030 [Limnochorda sp. L945t]
MRVPKFETIGVFVAETFQEQYYWDHHQKRTDRRPPLERALDYLSNTIGFNFITYTTPDYRNVPLVARYFSNISLDVANGQSRALPETLPDFPGVPATFYYHVDEPELGPMDMSMLDRFVTRQRVSGKNVIVNFCGLRRHRRDIEYAKEYLTRFELPLVSVDLYPCYYDGTDWEFTLKYLSDIRPYVKGKFMAIVQAFAKPGVWRYPTVDEMVRLAWECKDRGVDCLQFFVWNSGWSGTELLCGLDVLPREYHRTIAAMRG